MSTNRRWTDQELGVIADTLNEPAALVADFLGRSSKAVHGMRVRVRKGWAPRKLGWTADDDAVLRATSDLPMEAVATLLMRSVTAVSQRRSLLGITFTGASWQQRSPHNTRGRRLLAATCNTCGLLLDAAWFNCEKSGPRRGYWRSKCTRCIGTGRDDQPARSRNYYTKTRPTRLEAARRLHERKQALTRQHATRHREPYTEADHKVLADPGLTLLDKALRLGRTYDAISNQVSSHGYTSLVGLGDPANGQWQIRWEEPYRQALRRRPCPGDPAAGRA